MQRHRHRHTEPTLENRIRLDRATTIFRPLVRLGFSGTIPVTFEGRELLPDGPGLILSNHASLFDPGMTIIAAGRAINFLATAAAMQDPIMGRVLRKFGGVPKKKFTTDVGSIRLLKKWCDLGNLVGSYPEGERNWDGELLPFVPGIEALVRLLKVPVIPTRILNADRVMPRWATKRRSGRVHIQLLPPRTFERRADPKMIRAWIRDQLSIDQRDEANHFPVRGTRLAEGLENPLFRCPRCFAWNSLVPDGDEIRCRECTATWRVDTHNRLHGVSGRAQSTTIVAARLAVRERTETERCTDLRRFERDGIIAESEPAKLLDISGDNAKLIGHGRMILTRERLRVIDRHGTELLSLDLDELLVAAVEITRRLIFRTREHSVFEVVLPRESPLAWSDLTEYWRAQLGD